ncbi:GNAT family N-acetyltransferase [Rufibacter sp. LB8]|uniref:GNAT family N-acetyltransferase n=1 Tax=Rufibacter sp. LB8 TaxID=2777781 RepID=UPI00178C24D9|nr:GNAT family N-acetyltransferase [Rufibacter sp. LB8]
MLQLLTRNQIDSTQWEACLARAENSLVYAHAWYLDVVCQKKWHAIIEVQNGQYASLFPVPVTSFLGRKIVPLPLFAQQLGLFLTRESQQRNPAAYLNLLAQTYDEAVYQMPAQNFEPTNVDSRWQWRHRPNYELTLSEPYDVLRQRYSSNDLKRNLKKAAAAQLEKKPATSMKCLIQLFRLNKGLELTDLKERHYRRLEKLFQRAQQAGVGQVWEAWHEDQVVAAAFFLRTPQRTTYLFGASNKRGRKVAAMAFLLDLAIREEASTGKTFDFEGSEIPSVAKFYSYFGATPVPYVSLSLQPIPSATQWILNAFTSLRKRLR